jgi:GTP-binding protein EngB required for normal cell division
MHVKFLMFRLDVVSVSKGVSSIDVFLVDLPGQGYENISKRIECVLVYMWEKCLFSSCLVFI